MRTRLMNAIASATGAALLAIATGTFAAANFIIVNGDGPNEGFNDPTAVAPVGGNPGLTLGQQRLNAFQYAANIWGASLDSSPPIRILANFDPLTCTATSAVLGSAGPRFIFSDFPGAPVAGTWYHGSLANKIAGLDLLAGDTSIRARFNSNLGNANCLAGSPFYYGLDNNAGTAIDLVAVLLHEFAHGLGFSTVTSGTTGAQINGLPSIYDHFAFDNTQGTVWSQMTNAQRVASALNARQLVWAGASVTGAAPGVLSPGTPELQILAPSSIAGSYLVGTASFGPAFDFPGLTKQIMPVVENGALGLACIPFDSENRRAVKNRIALVFRGTCTFTTKVKNAQDAGAVGVLVVDNTAAVPPAGLGGVDPSIVIPSARIGIVDGNTILGALNLTPSNRSSGVVGRLGVDRDQLAGADKLGRVMLYATNPFQSGSSVSHWDTSASRNLLMEPSINADLTHFVAPPYDLTLPMFRDIGW